VSAFRPLQTLAASGTVVSMTLAKPSSLFLDFATGDGDQTLFGAPFLAQATSAVWSAEGGEERLSVKVLNGPCAGEQIHIASRTRETLREQLASRMHLSVIVYRRNGSSPAGMAAPELIRGET
jgi:hypothetical protein